MREVFVLGVGATGFARSDASARDLSQVAGAAALADAGLRSAEVTVATGHASAAETLQAGWQAVASGAHETVLCVGVEWPVRDDAHDRRLPAHAEAAKRYMECSGATVGHFARAAAQDRRHGADNPRALQSAPVDQSAVLESEVLAWPLRRLMVAPTAAGAAAIVLASSAAQRRNGARAPRLRGLTLLRDDDSAGATAARAALLVYAAAGIGPEEIDCAEIHDLTAAGEVAAYESLQFAPEGQGPELIDSGFTALGGVLPVNPSGGALAQGDAVGAAALAQLCELAWQLRGEAGRRQVAGARVGLALCAAAPNGEGSVLVVSLAIVTGG